MGGCGQQTDALGYAGQIIRNAEVHHPSRNIATSDIGTEAKVR